MVDDQKETEMVSITETETQVIDKAETVEELKARLDEAERRAKNKADEAERHFKKLAKFEQEEAKRKEAEMTELELANKHAQELEAKVRQLEISRLQHDIAAKVGLPSVLADRLRGETPEELEADAKLLLEAQPKQKATPNAGATNPGEQASKEETRAQKLKRLTGGEAEIWGGGGINWGPENPQ
jgi:predicted RNase H-like HicB family nuclease